MSYKKNMKFFKELEYMKNGWLWSNGRRGVRYKAKRSCRNKEYKLNAKYMRDLKEFERYDDYEDWRLDVCKQLGRPNERSMRGSKWSLGPHSNSV